MSLFNELKRRNVIRVAVAYVVISWLTVQVLDLAAESFEAPVWVMKMIITVLVIGFVPVVLFSWAFELTPEGIKKEKDVVRDESITQITAKKLDYITVAAALGVLGLFAYQQMNPPVAFQPSQQVSGSLAEDQGPAVENGTSSTIPDASIAVLPFTDLSPNKDQAYFSDGISEELLNVLVRVEGLTVASRTSSFGFKGQEALGIPVIAEKLNVRHVLEGSVRKSGETIRITAQLIDAQTDAHLWSETFDRQLTAENIFAIQDEISSAIVKQLRDELGANIGEKLSVEVMTSDLEAYDLYLQARPWVDLRSDLVEADKLLVRALEQDPNFVEAWELRAIIYTVIDDYSGNEFTQQDNIQKALEYSERAVTLKPESSVGLAVRSNIAMNFKSDPAAIDEIRPVDWSRVLRDLQRAVEIDPLNISALNWLGLAHTSVGNLEQGLNLFRECHVKEPGYTPCAENSVYALAGLGRDEEAITALMSFLNKGVYKHESVPLDLLARRDLELLFKVIANSRALFYGWNRHDELYKAYRKPGRYEELAQDLVAYAKENSPLPEHYVAGFAHVIGAYEMMPDRLTTWGASSALYRQSPEFKTYINNSGTHAYWRKVGFPPQCRAVGDNDFQCD